MLVSLYSAALFVSAFLLFWIEPLFTKMALPLLGGAPSVWNTALMFFQLVLLGGYGYAYYLDRMLPPRRQIWIHGALATAALAFLPIGIAMGTVPPTGTAPELWLLGELTASVGLPFFAIAASAPLLQAWFSRTADTRGRDPYFLYAASNGGSLLALVAFPLLIEPRLTLAAQSRVWAGLYGGLILLVLLCAALAGRKTIPASPAPMPPTGRADILIWMALAAVPSSLMLGVTSYITTDLGSAPLFWVLPLGLYLLTFILAFAWPDAIPLNRLSAVQAAALLLVTTFVLIGLLFGRGIGATVLIGVHLLAFLVTALVCHTALARRRPTPAALTRYYFYVSAGGALGGLFNALVAPALFSGNYEYELGLVAAAALRGVAVGHAERLRLSDLLGPLLFGGVLAAGVVVLGSGESVALMPRAILLLACTVPVYGFRDRPNRFALGMAGLLVVAIGLDGWIGVLHQDRSFFGVNRVLAMENGAANALYHGTTVHGREATDKSRWREPQDYYARSGPAGQLLTARREFRSVTLIGLGAGALTCYRMPGQRWQIFEIDPAVLRLAGDTHYFHYLAECGADIPVILGDGRLSLAALPDGSEDLIIVDAFSSDAIPLHLLTREALRLYLGKLGTDGVVLLHISNRYLSLAPIVAELAADAGVTAKRQLYVPSIVERAADAGESEWVALARRPAALDFLDGRWQILPPSPGVPLWTDDFSNILTALR